MKNTNTRNSNNNVPAVKVRYDRALNQMRRVRTSSKTKDIQKDICHLINHIESYGFNFLPNFYVHDEVIQLEELVDKLQVIEKN